MDEASRLTSAIEQSDPQAAERLLPTSASVAVRPLPPADPENIPPGWRSPGRDGALRE